MIRIANSIFLSIILVASTQAQPRNIIRNVNSSGGVFLSDAIGISDDNLFVSGYTFEFDSLSQTSFSRAYFAVYTKTGELVKELKHPATTGYTIPFKTFYDQRKRVIYAWGKETNFIDHKIALIRIKEPEMDVIDYTNIDIFEKCGYEKSNHISMDETSYNVTKIKNDNFIISGCFLSEQQSRYKPFIIITDSLGNETKHIDSSEFAIYFGNRLPALSSFVEHVSDSNSSYYGYTYNSMTNDLIELDSNFNIVSLTKRNQFTHISPIKVVGYGDFNYSAGIASINFMGKDTFAFVIEKLTKDGQPIKSKQLHYKFDAFSIADFQSIFDSNNWLTVDSLGNLFVSHFASRYKQLIISKLDTSLDVQWQRNFTAYDVDSKYVFNGITSTDDGLFIYGYICTNRAQQPFCKYNTMPYLARFTQDGVFTSMHSIVKNTSVENNFYPNPTSDYLYFVNEKSIAHAEVLNWSGNSLLQSFAGEVLDVSTLSSGFYYLRITYRDGRQIRKKLIKK